jgi:hypothetical protein
LIDNLNQSAGILGKELYKNRNYKGTVIWY